MTTTYITKSSFSVILPLSNKAVTQNEQQQKKKMTVTMMSCHVSRAAHTAILKSACTATANFNKPEKHPKRMEPKTAYTQIYHCVTPHHNVFKCEIREWPTAMFYVEEAGDLVAVSGHNRCTLTNMLTSGNRF